MDFFMSCAETRCPTQRGNKTGSIGSPGLPIRVGVKVVKQE